jgi:hypothetical protein
MSERIIQGTIAIGTAIVFVIFARDIVYPFAPRSQMYQLHMDGQEHMSKEVARFINEHPLDPRKRAASNLIDLKQFAHQVNDRTMNESTVNKDDNIVFKSWPTSFHYLCDRMVGTDLTEYQVSARYIQEERQFLLHVDKDTTGAMREAIDD